MLLGCGALPKMPVAFVAAVIDVIAGTAARLAVVVAEVAVFVAVIAIGVAGALSCMPWP